MKLCWASAFVTALNWAVASLIVWSSDALYYGSPTPPETWALYAGFALIVALLVATGHPELARLLAVLLFVATVIAPLFIGLWMLPSAVAALSLAIRAPAIRATRS